jgi:hypothetical protein
MIADDGIGFEHSTEKTGGRRGLSIMQRLAPQAGTEIVLAPHDDDQQLHPEAGK